MFQHAVLHDLETYFQPLSAREKKSVFFCRIDGFSIPIQNFVKNYYEAARKSGVIIEGKLANPDQKNLEYYEEIMGMDFRMQEDFLRERLHKWLPRMNAQQCAAVSAAIFSTLQDMAREGKNENMLRNAYIKYMCWLYYRFERIVNQLGAENPPKILYDGAISNYELRLFVVLSRAGADIVLLERDGDQAYLKLDPQSAFSCLYRESGQTAFPSTFSLQWIQKELEKDLYRQQLYGEQPTAANCTNAWMEKADLEAMLTHPQSRGTDPRFYYNCFFCQYGAEDKLTYTGDLYRLYQELKGSGRPVCVVNNGIAPPTPEEIATVDRKQYQTVEQVLLDLSAKIQYPASRPLQAILRKAFLDLLLEESARLDGNVRRLTNCAVYLLCWLRRYQAALFSQWRLPELSVFILFGSCKSENEALFIRMLARLPVDVLVLIPDLNAPCCLHDPTLLERRYAVSLTLAQFPTEQAQVRLGTAAFHAERELDALLYTDSGMYRNQQYAKANAVSLQTMYEEIPILWDQELKYRPNFCVTDQTVTLPVLFAKVSGVKDRQISAYWAEMKKLITPDTLVVRSAPWLSSTDKNPIKPFVTQFLKNGKILRQKIKAHSAYAYGLLRDEMQEYLLDKLQQLLDQRLIRGTFENGTEYTILAVVLNLEKSILRLIQRFDFTKKNPKLIYINPGEEILSLEDSIVSAFLHLIGFDVLFFIPTGYQSIEKHFRQNMIEEYQIGDYLYDLTVPNFDILSTNERHSWRERLFGRGI